VSPSAEAHTDALHIGMIFVSSFPFLFLSLLSLAFVLASMGEFAVGKH